MHTKLQNKQVKYFTLYYFEVQFSKNNFFHNILRFKIGMYTAFLS